MQLNPDLPLSDKFQARLAAQAICRNNFNLTAAGAELRPDLKHPGPFGARLMDEPAVVHEVNKIMNRGDRNVTRYKSLMWDWLEAPADGTKETEENRRTAARILAKPYLDPKMARGQEAAQGFVVEGLESGAGV